MPWPPSAARSEALASFSQRSLEYWLCIYRVREKRSFEGVFDYFVLHSD
jgi:hypothetical protein